MKWEILERDFGVSHMFCFFFFFSVSVDHQGQDENCWDCFYCSCLQILVMAFQYMNLSVTVTEYLWLKGTRGAFQPNSEPEPDPVRPGVQPSFQYF